MTKSSAQRREKLSPIHPGEILAEEFLIPMKISQYRLARGNWRGCATGSCDHPRRAVDHGGDSASVLALLRQLRAVLGGTSEPVRP